MRLLSLGSLHIALLQLFVNGLLLGKLGGSHRPVILKGRDNLPGRSVLLMLDMINGSGSQLLLGVLQNFQLCLFKDSLRRLDP